MDENTHTKKTKKQLDKKSVQIEDKMSNGIYVARLVTRSGVLIFNFSQLSCRLLRILTSEHAQILFTVSSQSPTPLGFVHSDDLMSVRNALSFYSQL